MDRQKSLTFYVKLCVCVCLQTKYKINDMLIYAFFYGLMALMRKRDCLEDKIENFTS